MMDESRIDVCGRGKWKGLWVLRSIGTDKRGVAREKKTYGRPRKCQGQKASKKREDIKKKLRARDLDPHAR